VHVVLKTTLSYIGTGNCKCMRVNGSYTVGNKWRKPVPTHAITVVLALVALVKLN